MMKLLDMPKKLSINEPYSPAEDTFFFAEHLKDESGEKALDVGTGSGYLAKLLSSNFKLIIATDLDFNSLKHTHKSIENCICCNGASPILEKFDLIVCNLPYLPSDSIQDITVDGGKEGIIIPINIINTVKNLLKTTGKFLFLTSSHANYKNLIDHTKSLGFTVKIIGKKKLFFEELILVEARKKQTY